MEHKCEVEGCKKPWKYALYEVHSDGSKTWLHICIDCEKVIGDRNLRRRKLCKEK